MVRFGLLGVVVPEAGGVLLFGLFASIVGFGLGLFEFLEKHNKRL